MNFVFLISSYFLPIEPLINLLNCVKDLKRMSEINTPAAGGLTERWTRTDKGKMRFMEILEEKRSCKMGKNIVSYPEKNMLILLRNSKQFIVASPNLQKMTGSALNNYL